MAHQNHRGDIMEASMNTAAFIVELIPVAMLGVIVFICICLSISKAKKWHRRERVCTEPMKFGVAEVYERRGHGISYKPIFVVQSGGQDIVIKSALYDGIRRYYIGEQIDMLVNPNNIHEFMYTDKREKLVKLMDIGMPIAMAITVVCAAVMVVLTAFD